jgi:hypothetical protein
VRSRLSGNKEGASCQDRAIIVQWPKSVFDGRNMRRQRISAEPILMWPGRGWRLPPVKIAAPPFRRQPCGHSIRNIEVHCERAGLSSLNEGQRVEFEIMENRGRTSAKHAGCSSTDHGGGKGDGVES